MLLSFENARHVLAKMWFVYGGLYAMALALFQVTMISVGELTENAIIAIAISLGIGFIEGLYFVFRTKFDSASVLRGLPLGLLALWFAFGGSALAFVMHLAGRSDLRWLAFCTHATCLMLALLGGMCHEARRLDWWSGESTQWKNEIEKYINYSSRQVSPSLTTSASNNGIEHPFWIAAIGSANIPLLFEMYGGGRVNAIFFAAPLMTFIFIYVNFKNLGPAIVRLFFLRKLEKSLGYRFQNADYEQIQELRRGFFLARWLMKDYRPPMPRGDTEISLAPSSKDVRKRKRRR